MIFVVAIVSHAIAAACIFLGKDTPRQVFMGLLIAELAVALVWIVIRMVSQCRERTSLRTARSEGEPNTENDINTKALVKNDDTEQNQADTKAVIEEEEERPKEAERKRIEDDEGTGKLSQTDGTEAPIDEEQEEEEELNEAERKQIEDDAGAGKRSQVEEGGRKVPDDDWLNRIVIAIAVLLVIAGLASHHPRSARPMAEQVSGVLSATFTPEQLSTVFSTALILEHVTKVRSGASTRERSQVENAPALTVRETSTPPTAPARRHRHHRVNVSTFMGGTEVPPDKTRRIHRHRKSGIGDTRRDHRTA
jgi:hypothetical protein